MLEVVNVLNGEFREEDRRFTLDGHLVGSIGEVVAAYAFNLRLLANAEEGHDAELIAEDHVGNLLVQIKLTCGIRGVSFYSVPKHLIVLQLIEGEPVKRIV